MQIVWNFYYWNREAQGAMTKLKLNDYLIFVNTTLMNI